MPNGMVLRWGLWEVPRYEDGALMNEISALIKENPQSSLAPSAMLRIQLEGAVYESSSRLSPNA